MDYTEIVITMPEQLTCLIEKAKLKHFPKGQIILYEGDIPDHIFILKSGIIKIYDIDEQGNEKVLHVVKPPAVVPFAFFSNSSAGTRWFYGALVDCDVYVLPASRAREYMRADSELTLYLMSWFSREVHELLVRLSSLGKSSVRDKLEAALRFLAVCHSKQRPSGWYRVSFPVCHQLLADMIGVTRESTAMSMKELQDEGIIRNPRLTILEISFEKLTI